MALNLKPHVRARTRDGEVEKVVPYLVMNNGNEASVFLQDGKAYGAGGHSIKTVPIWVKERLKDMNPKVLKEVGWA